MNSVDGACAVCGGSATYTGRLPILCPLCYKARESLRKHGMLGYAPMERVKFPRLWLTDKELRQDASVGVQIKEAH